MHLQIPTAFQQPPLAPPPSPLVTNELSYFSSSTYQSTPVTSPDKKMHQVRSGRIHKKSPFRLDSKHAKPSTVGGRPHGHPSKHSHHHHHGPKFLSSLASTVSYIQQLFDACSQGDVFKLLQVLPHVSPNASDTSHRTALHFASASGHASCLDILLSHGACVSVSDCNGNSPLHLAVLGGWVECVVLLLRAGADPEGKDRGQRTPVMLVRARVRMLGDRAVDGDVSGLVDELRKLIEILTVCSSYGPNSIVPPIPDTTPEGGSPVDASLLASKLRTITSDEETVAVMDDLKTLLESLELKD
ncbi:ankyrin repeat-containing domain protein [Gaertneriomyces semiglobifer]|nr:ankyrin repeat-containing domain protein [Gaertneriomyces semiglobifer]